MFCGGEDFHAVLPQTHFHNRTVISVTSKTVELPDDDIFPILLCTIRNHFHEVNPLFHIFTSGRCSINIDCHNAVVICFAEGTAVTKLPFNGLVTLACGAIPKIESNILIAVVKRIWVFLKLRDFFLCQTGEVDWKFFHANLLFNSMTLPTKRNRPISTPPKTRGG